MPKISALRKARLKKELLNPKNTIKSALLQAGFTKQTAHKSSMVKSVKVCQEEIMRELRAVDITEEWLLNRYLSAEMLAIKKEDPSAYALIINSIAKYIVKSPDRIMDVTTAEEKSELSRIRGLVSSN